MSAALVLLATLRFVEDVGLLGAIGAFTVRRLARQTPRIGWADPPLEPFLAAALAGGAVLLVAQREWAGLVRVLAEAGALGLCLRGRRYVAPFAVLAALLLPLTGHAAGVQPQPAGAVFADALHVTSAGMWAGGVFGLAALRPPQGWRGADARDLLARFGRVAVIAFGVTALTGVLRATEQLAAVGDLWSTPYGAVLVLKAAATGVMIALSFAWRRGLSVGRADAAAAAAVVAFTAILGALPPR